MDNTSNEWWNWSLELMSSNPCLSTVTTVGANSDFWHENLPNQYKSIERAILLSLPFSALSPRCGLIPVSYQPKQSFEIDGSSHPIGKKSLSHSEWDKEYPVTPISRPSLWYIFHGLTHISRNPYLGWKLLPPVLRNLTYPQKLLNWDPSCFTCLKYESIKPTPCIFILG